MNRVPSADLSFMGKNKKCSACKPSNDPEGQKAKSWNLTKRQKRRVLAYTYFPVEVSVKSHAGCSKMAMLRAVKGPEVPP
jgi:hypothetical protein